MHDQPMPPADEFGRLVGRNLLEDESFIRGGVVNQPDRGPAQAGGVGGRNFQLGRPGRLKKLAEHRVDGGRGGGIGEGIDVHPCDCRHAAASRSGLAFRAEGQELESALPRCYPCRMVG